LLKFYAQIVIVIEFFKVAKFYLFEQRVEKQRVEKQWEGVDY